MNSVHSFPLRDSRRDALGLARQTPAGLRDGAPLSAIHTLPAIVEMVAGDMVLCEEALTTMLESSVDAVSEINGYLQSAGGKRLRPMLTALGARAIGIEGDISRLMCVGELIHLGSLLHDDVVDDGQERRGRPAAHKVYGNPAAILSGDFCLGRAVWLAAEEGGHAAVTELGRAAAAMAEGEVLQLLAAGNLQQELTAYLDIIDRKSAGLIAWCASAGALKIGDTAAAAALGQFGREVGIAFQITDDVLDYTGDKRQTGKRRGKDLEEGKPTLPLLLALDRVPSLRHRLARGAPSPERVPAILQEVIDCGATDDALNAARERIATGVDALKVLPDTRYRRALASLGHHLVERVK